MKTLSRLVAIGAVASGVGGVLLAVTDSPAGAATISPGSLAITGPQMVTISAQRDLTDSAQLLVDGTVVDSACAVGCKTTLLDKVNSTTLGAGSHSVVLMEKAAGLGSAFRAAAETITVHLPQASSGSGGSGGSGGSSGSSGSGGSTAHSGAASSAPAASSGGGAPVANSNAPAPAAIGYNGPSSGGNSFGSTYSRLDALSGGSALVLPDVAPRNGFQLPIKPPKQARLAGSPSHAKTLTAATWLIGVALALVMMLTAAHTGRWARRRRRLSAAGATAGSAMGGGASAAAVASPAAVRRTAAGRSQPARRRPAAGSMTSERWSMTVDSTGSALAERGGRHRGQRERRAGRSS